MADLDERLNRLISDEDSMKRVLELASAVMAQRGSASSKTEPAETAAKEGEIIDPPPPDLASVLASLGAGSGDPAGTGEQENDPGADPAGESPGTGGKDRTAAFAAVLPELLQALSGKGNLLNGERVNLIKAMKPYMAEKRLGSLDRAMKMANVTKAAKDVLRLLGR